MMMRRKP